MFYRGVVDDVVCCRCGQGRSGPRLEPVAAKVEEAAFGPVARGQEQYEQQDGAVYAGSVEKVGTDEEEEDEGGGGVGGDEEKRKPAGKDRESSQL